MQVRELVTGELEEALALVRAEGWAFAGEEFARLLENGVCLVLDDGARLRGLLTVVRYPGVSWVGNVVVDPALRGRGLGEDLVRAAVERARASGQPTVALYSVPKAVRLYARAGFVEQGAVVAMGGLPPPREVPAGVDAFEPSDLAEVAAYDAPRAGYDRASLLRSLVQAYAGTCHVLRREGRVEGYAVAKPSWSGTEIGPVVADRADDRAALLDASLAVVPQGPVDVAVPAAAEDVLARLAGLGFERRFEAPAMYVGPPPPTRWEAVGAVGGLEKG